MLSPIPMAAPTAYTTVAERPSYDATSTGSSDSNPFGNAILCCSGINDRIVYKQRRQTVYTTSGLDTELRIHAPTLPSNDSITNQAEAFIDKLPESGQTHLAKKFLAQIHNAIFANSNYREFVPFTQIIATRLDDDTLLFEWVYKYGRVNFFIDVDANESSAVFLDGSVDMNVPLVFETSFDGSSVADIALRASNFVARFA